MSLKSQNQNITNLLKFIDRTEGASKLEIADGIMVSPAALTKISKKLIGENILLEKKSRDENGRKKNLLLINYDKFNSVGILIEKGYTKIILTNLKDKIIDSIEFEHDFDSNFDRYLITLLENIEEIIEKNNINIEKILGIGIIVSNEFVVKKSLELFKEDKFLPLKKIILKKYGRLVFVETKVNALALYESFLNPDYKNFFLVKYGENKGTSIIVDNKLINPAISHYRSIGTRHFIVDPESEVYCDICKKKGCYDTLVSPKYIFQEILKESNYASSIKEIYEDISLEEFIKRAENGGVLECKALKKVAKYTAILMINHNNFLPLDNFLLAGKAFKSQLFLSYLRMYLQEFQLGEVHEKIFILDENSQREELSASFLVTNYVFYNYNFFENELFEED